jgi:hypothetical protein
LGQAVFFPAPVFPGMDRRDKREQIYNNVIEIFVMYINVFFG